ncbi:MAG: class I SAM-dependent methyltransferase [Methylovirgula sp.]|uniref:class I SAM-dependent methyltransferase n=1 Tax=Methylovirgula sp. TaxID=1978224 RepID=UPI0030768348
MMSITVDEVLSSPAKPTIGKSLIEKIWHGVDPYQGFPVGLYADDPQGWGSQHHYLDEAVKTLRPNIIVEVGVWKGGSTISLAKALRASEIDGCVISVDTWLGSWDHWTIREWFDNLNFVNGQSQLMRTFMQNICANKLTDYVVPLPLDSINAFEVIRRHGIVPDCVHIDAGHDYRAVSNDLEMWWSILRPGGILIGDDYQKEGGWVEVRRAFDDFFEPLGLYPFECSPSGSNKCRITKPAA